MPAWDAQQYLRFERERTQPSRDLVGRIDVPHPRRVVDLGCGPGNSTAVLRARWPSAETIGVDSSAEMLDRARASDPSVTWVQADLRSWTPTGPVDVVLSNAVLQWVPDHASVMPRIVRWLAPEGAFAAQMPANVDAPYQLAADRVRRRAPWSELGSSALPSFGVESRGFYYDLLAPLTSRIELWDTEYVHVMPGPEAIVAWTAGTGLRPWLATLPGDDARQRFLREYAIELEDAYPRQHDGRRLFPFLRRFLLAYR